MKLKEAVLYICCVVVFFLAVIFGFFEGADVVRYQAVKAGVAEYYLDANHERQWRWITNSTP